MTDQKPTRKRAQCPQGHFLPTKTNGVWCRKDMCGGDTQAQVAVEKDGTLNLDKLAEVKSDPAEVARAERHTSVGLRKSLKGDEAVKWAQDKMVELLPEAVANVAWDLRYGTDKQRAEATDRVLKANGMDKREARQEGQQGLIILNLGQTTDSSLPWLQRLKPTPKAVADAVDVGEEDEE